MTLQFMHSYVPGHDEESEEKPAKVLSGGNYLTFERHNEAQSAMHYSKSPSARIEGLISKIEYFHALDGMVQWL